MNKASPLRPGVGLLLLSVILLVLNQVEAPRPVPHELSVLSGIRMLLGLPVVLFVPGYFLVPILLDRDTRSRSGEGLDLGWVLLSAAALSLLGHFVHFNLLRLLHLDIGWQNLGLLALVECSVGLFVLRRRLRGVVFATPSAQSNRALKVGVALVLLFAGWSWNHLVRDGSWYFFNDSIEQGWLETQQPEQVEVVWGDSSPLRSGSLVPAGASPLQLSITNRSSRLEHVPVFFAVHGRVGTRVSLRQAGRVHQGEQIANQAFLNGSTLPVERYFEWGTASAIALDCRQRGGSGACLGLPVPPGATATLELLIQQPEGHPQGSPGDTAVIAWAHLSSESLLERLKEEGHHHVHPFQLLNVTENIRWASEITRQWVLPGRSVDGKSTLHQPPAWTYLYAPARELLSDQTASAGLLLVAILLGVLLTGIKALEDQALPVPPAFGIVLGFSALQHGRLMVEDGSLNFPDSLYALALLVSISALVGGRTRVFLLWAFLAAFLRYPGAVVVGLSGLCLLAVQPHRRKRIATGLVRFSLYLAATCGVMLLVGIKTRSLDTWFFALYFETIPEHFQANPDALPLLRRPIEFLRLWAVFGGGVVLLAFPARGTLARVALGTALLYFPFLGFIDHTSHHYFLPLIAMVGLGTCASIQRTEDPRVRKRLAMAAAAVAAFLFLVIGEHGLRI